MDAAAKAVLLEEGRDIAVDAAEAGQSAADDDDIGIDDVDQGCESSRDAVF